MTLVYLWETTWRRQCFESWFWKRVIATHMSGFGLEVVIVSSLSLSLLYTEWNFISILSRLLTLLYLYLILFHNPFQWFIQFILLFVIIMYYSMSTDTSVKWTLHGMAVYRHSWRIRLLVVYARKTFRTTFVLILLYSTASVDTKVTLIK